MKKTIGLLLTAMLLLLALAGCGNNNNNNDDLNDNPEYGADQNDNNSNSTKDVKITVISREDGSGTRGAFIELFEIEEKDENGDKVDYTIATAEITNSTSVMMTSVAGDPSAIGYISLGSLNNTVKALNIDGVAPSVDAIKDGSYTISRPFMLAVQEGNLSPVAQDFLDFILSTEGQDVVEGRGYIRIDDTEPYAGNKPAGTVVVAGSSSVTPVMESLKEAYEELNPGAEIEIQQSDSTTGMNAAIEGICDIGMASRDLKDSELDAGLTEITMAFDGIAVIANHDNSADNLSKEQVKGIYTGTITNWAEVD